MCAYTQISGIILTSRKLAGAEEARAAESMMDGSMRGGDGRRRLGSRGKCVRKKVSNVA